MTDNEIMEIVSRNMRGSFDPGNDRRHVFRFHREIDGLAAGMSPPEAAQFKERANAALDRWLNAMQEVIDERPDRPNPRPAPRARSRQSGGGYVGRTVIRAVVWNIVNSIFRAFR